MAKLRLGEVLQARGLVSDSHEAFVIVTEGRVYMNGQKAISPGQLVGDKDVVEVRALREFVGRGAYKLEAALKEFHIDMTDAVCADVGAATGGFTEVLLKRGAAKVYAIDAGRGKLDLKLRQDPCVITMEGVSVLSMSPPPEPIDCVTIDVSFTALHRVLPAIKPWLKLLYNSHDRGKRTTNHGGKGAGSVIALFKPQYEVGDKSLLEHGILRDDAVRAALIGKFRAWLAEHGWRELGSMESPIRGSEGNVEYLFHLRPV